MIWPTKLVAPYTMISNFLSAIFTPTTQRNFEQLSIIDKSSLMANYIDEAWPHPFIAR